MLSRIARLAGGGVVLTLASALYAAEFNWPDYYHIEYGLPLAWLIRTLSTIAGPTDTLAFQPPQFIIDWIFWSIIAFLLFFAIDPARHPTKSKPQ